MALAGCAGGDSAAGWSEGEAWGPTGHLVPVAPPATPNHRDRALPWWRKANVHADRWTVRPYAAVPVDTIGAAVLADVDASTRARHGDGYRLANGCRAYEGGQSGDLFSRGDEGRRQPLVLVRQILDFRL